MEVEVKIRLADAAAHQTVAALLAPAHQITHLQENVFFDGGAQQLSSQRMVLRLRFYNGDERCVVTLKGKAIIIDGISRGSEVLFLLCPSSSSPSALVCPLRPPLPSPPPDRPHSHLLPIPATISQY